MKKPILHTIKKLVLYIVLAVSIALIFLIVSFSRTVDISVEHAVPSDLPVTAKIIMPLPLESKIDYVRIRDMFRGKDVERVQVDEKIFSLTFDGGGDARSAEKILDLLSKNKIPATFFLTGHFMGAFPEIVAAIQANGGEIGNHTMTHKDLSKLSEEEVIAEIDGMERVVKEQGISVAPFFRFPYGAPTKETIALVNERGYVSVRWTVDSLGWQGTKDGHDAAFVVDRVTQKAIPGGIALMHIGAAKDGTTFDADALELVIAELTKQGYRFVSLSELFHEAIKNTAR